jgi:hypothetical protein
MIQIKSTVVPLELEKKKTPPPFILGLQYEKVYPIIY